jgi:hypothetical protein
VGREIGGEGAGIGADDGGGTGPLEIEISAQFQNCSAKEGEIEKQLKIIDRMKNSKH